jgi:ceramide glucosyltransferase
LLNELAHLLFLDTPLWVRVVTLIALAGALVEVLLGLAAWWIRKTGERKYALSRKDSEFSPRCALIVPTKGLPEGAVENFTSFLVQSCQSYEVYFVVESEQDAGAPLLRSIVRSHANAHLVTAGLSVRCAQKNHNMLAGVKAAGEVDVLAFADNDIRPPAGWLAALTAPLADPRISVTSGFRWIRPASGSFAAQAHTLLNMAIYVYMAVTARFNGAFLWGGSFAIRRKDFLELGVEERWGETFSDDMSLSGLLVRHGRKALLIPGLLIPTGETVKTAGQAARWFGRQVLCLKAYQYCIWALAGLPVFLFAAGLYLLFFAALALSAAGLGSFWNIGGGAWLVFMAVEMIVSLVYGLLGPTTKHWLFVLRKPLLLATMIAGFLRTVGSDRMDWSGVVYRFDRSGKVIEVIRRGKETAVSSGGADG